jgi:hypothetical protein
MTMNDVGPAGNECFFPTLSKTITLLNTTVNNCNMEYDKQVDMFILDHSLVNNVVAQSTSNHTIHLKNGSLASLGTQQNVICENSTLDPLFISTNFGATKTFSGTNCIITNLGIGNCCNIMQLYPDTSTGLLAMAYTGSGQATTANFDSCVGTFGSPPQPSCYNPPQFDYAPGTIMTFMSTVGDARAGFQFRITDNSFSPNSTNNTVGTFTVQTSITGASLPGGMVAAAGPKAIPDYNRSWSCSNCTGSLDAVDLSQAGAQNAPLYTYSKRTYTCKNNLPNIPNSIDINSNTTTPTNGPFISGNFVFLKINVIQADTTGATPGLFDPTSKFGNYPTIDQTSGAGGSIGESIDLTHTGLRTINPTTTSGAVGSDVLTAPGANQWLGGGQTNPWLATDLSSELAASCPVVSVEWQADRTTLKFP